MPSRAMILIAGEGQSGTTMLLYFLSALLGKPYLSEEFLKTGRTDFPEIIKHNGIGHSLERRMAEHGWKVEHLYWITLGPELAADKRIAKIELSIRTGYHSKNTNAWKLLGLNHSQWLAISGEEQRDRLIKFFQDGEELTKNVCKKLGIPFTYIDYYKFCSDVRYAYEVIAQDVDYVRFCEVWKKQIDPTMVRKKWER